MSGESIACESVFGSLPQGMMGGKPSAWRLRETPRVCKGHQQWTPADIHTARHAAALSSSLVLTHLHALTRALTGTLTHTVAHSHAHTYTPAHTRAVLHTRTLLTRSRTRSRTHTNTHNHMCSHALALSLARTHAFAHSAHTRTT